MKKKTKRNPADLTKRNNDARKKEIAELKQSVLSLQKAVWSLMDSVETLHLEIVRLKKRDKGWTT